MRFIQYLIIGKNQVFGKLLTNQKIAHKIVKPRRVWQLNPLPVFPLTSKLCFDPNLKVLKTLGFWNYT